MNAVTAAAIVAYVILGAVFVLACCAAAARGDR